MANLLYFEVGQLRNEGSLMCIFKAIWWDLMTKHYVSVTLVKIGPSSLFVIEGDRIINGPKVWVTNFNRKAVAQVARWEATCHQTVVVWLNSCNLICKHVATSQSQSVQLICDVSRDAKRSQTNSRQTLSNCYFIAVVKHQLQLTAKGHRHALHL